VTSILLQHTREEIDMTQDHFVVGTYTDEAAAHKALEAAIAADCPMDQVSVLSRLRAEGDDVLGVVNPDVIQRMGVWGKQGAFWGGIAGLLASTAAAFWLPVVGPVVAVGHILAAFEAGVAGAAVGGAGLAGAAAVSQLAVILHRHGLPERALADLHRKVESGQVLIVVQAGDPAEAARYSDALTSGAAEQVLTLP
jgi:hypothetical protein